MSHVSAICPKKPQAHQIAGRRSRRGSLVRPMPADGRRAAGRNLMHVEATIAAITVPLALGLPQVLE